MDKLILQIQDLEKQLHSAKHACTNSNDRLHASEKELYSLREQQKNEERTIIELRGEIAKVKAAADSKDREIGALRNEMTDKTSLVESLQQTIMKLQTEKDEAGLRYATQISSMFSSIVKSKQFYISKINVDNNANDMTNVAKQILAVLEDNHPPPTIIPSNEGKEIELDDDENMVTDAPLSLPTVESNANTLPMTLDGMNYDEDNNNNHPNDNMVITSTAPTDNVEVQ